MDFRWPDELEQYRSDVRSFVDEHVDQERGTRRASVEYDAEWSRSFCRAAAARGFLVPHWPEAWGGGGLSTWHQLIVAEEMWRRGEPRAPQYLNINFIGPAIMRFGTEHQRRTHLTHMAEGRALWCQGFSEVDAGSDLSRIRTTARRADGGYLLRGAKMWISYADVAEHCFLLARLEGGGEASGDRRSRVVLLVDMRSSGITVREVPSIVGPHTFHEVVFDDVFVPATDLLGDEGEGWSVVTAALADERVGAPEYMQSEATLDRVLALCDDQGAKLPETTEASLGQASARCHAARLLTYRAVEERVNGRSASASAYAARAYGRIARQATADAVLATLQDLGDLDAVEADVEPLNAVLAGIAGGAYEILLDLVATDLTGLRRS